MKTRYRLIVPDLRGYGATDKAPTGYDKRTMANDIRALMANLGIERAAIVAHDRGVRVGLRLVKDHPAAVARFAALDNIPTRLLFGSMNARVAQASWFFLFQGVRDLPEALIQGREELWLRYILTSWTYDPGALSDADIAAYVHAYAQPGGLRGAFEDYRAWREDLAQDEEDKDIKIRCPTLALWGSEFEAAKMVDMAELWRGIADDLTIGAQAAMPGRQVVTLSGDGGIAMLLGDLLTLRQLNLPVKVVVFNNGSLGFVELEMKAAGWPSYGTDLVNPDFAALAESADIRGIRVEAPEDLRSALQIAFDHDSPCLVDVKVNRQELAMPPTITVQQALGFSLYMMRAVLSGRGDEVIDLAASNLLPR